MRIRAYLVAVAALSFGTAQAATVLKTMSRDLTDNSESVVTVYAQDGKMRVAGGSAQDSYAIFRDDALHSINVKDRSYMSMDRASMKQMAAVMNPAMKQMQEQLARMSPEQRAQMERMMGTQLPEMGKPVVEEIRKTGKTDKVAGYTCTYSQMLQDGVLTNEFCIVPLKDLKGGQDLYEASLKVSSLMEAILDEMDAPWLRQMADRQVTNYAKLGGVPVFARTFSGGKPVLESTLQSIETLSVPTETFEIPAGFTRKDLMQGAGMGR